MSASGLSTLTAVSGSVHLGMCLMSTAQHITAAHDAAVGDRHEFDTPVHTSLLQMSGSGFTSYQNSMKVMSEYSVLPS